MRPPHRCPRAPRRYPLVTVCAGALGVLCYSSYRTLAYNPDVR